MRASEYGRRPWGVVDCEVCMVFTLLRAKKKRSPNRRLALTKNGGKRYLEVVSLKIGLLERRRFGSLFLCLNVS
jgi:hypothetical protein